MGLIAFIAALLRRHLPRTYVRVDDLRTGGWFICDLKEAGIEVEQAIADAERDGEGWRWADDRLEAGRMVFTFVRVSPRRAALLNQFEAY